MIVEIINKLFTNHLINLYTFAANKFYRMKKILLSFFTIACTVSGFAQTTIENFTYTTTGVTANDTLTNPSLAGAIWKRHSGTGGPLTYNPTGLTYTGYVGSGIGSAVNFSHITSTSREDANAALTSSYTSGSVYFSALIRISAVPASSNDYHLHLGGTAGTTVTGFFARTFIKEGSIPGTNFKIGISKNSTSTISYTTTDFSLNTTYLVVAKYTFNSVSTTDDVVSLYVFSSGVPSTEPTTPSAVSTDATGDATALGSICLRQGTGSSGLNGIIDGIRVSNSWLTSVLPVKLVNFSANLSNNQTELNWSTASETNNKGFEIERSNDGKNFTTIAFVQGAGNSNRLLSYSFIDDNKATAYYRLKQIDFDGKFEYSNLVKVNSDELLIDLNPNPFNDNIVISSANKIVNAEIIDINGKTKIMEIINNNKATINTSSLSSGVYFVRVNDGVKVITKRIIKN